MPFEVKLRIEDKVATMTLAGELDATSAPRFNDAIIDAARNELTRLVLLAEDLSYMSSAGLRCLVFAQQKLPRGSEIVLVGAQPDVAETIRLTGFDRSILMEADGRG